MLGSLASVQLPIGCSIAGQQVPNAGAQTTRAVYRALRNAGFEAVLTQGPAGGLLLRISAQAYNSIDQYERLIEQIAMPA